MNRRPRRSSAYISIMNVRTTTPNAVSMGLAAACGCAERGVEWTCPRRTDTWAESRRQWKLDRTRSRRWEPTRSTRCDWLSPLLRSRWRCRGRAASLGAGVGLRFRRGDQGTIDDLKGPHRVGYQAHAAPAGFGAHDAQHGRERPIGARKARPPPAPPSVFVATAQPRCGGCAVSATEMAPAGRCSFSRTAIARRVSADTPARPER